MSHYAQGRRDLVARIEHIRTGLALAITDCGNQRFRELHSSWDADLAQLLEDCRRHPKVPIALVGPTGAGKSTLVNALIGACILPISNEKVCTSSVTEVGYSDGPDYEAIVEFITEREWDVEREAILGDLTDEGEEVANPGYAGDVDGIRAAARDKILAVYRPDDPANADLAELCRRPPPAAMRRAFAVGTERVTSDDPGRFAELIADYLDSQGRIWPLVRSVKIRGPFEPLEGGASVVDLPGLNDPNEARERVTRDYIKDSRYIWVVFEIKRGLNRDLYTFLQTNDLFRQLVMDGRTDALTFVATSSDNLSLDAARKKYSLGPKPTKAEAVAARNGEASQYVLAQLNELANGLASRAGEGADQGQQLAREMSDSAIFTVSAREFLRLSGLAEEDDGGLKDVEQSGLPALRRHLDTISGGLGVAAQLKETSSRLEVLLARVESEWQSQNIRLEGQTETDIPQRLQIEEVLGKAHCFLVPSLDSLRERFIQDLEASQDVLGQRLSWAFSRGQAELDKYLDRLGGLFWGTLRAMARRDGRYSGSSGTFDFSADIAKPILDSIAFAWNNFFGTRLQHDLREWTERLVRQADQHRQAMLSAIEEVVKPSPAMRRDLKNFFEQTRKVLDEQLAQIQSEMENRINEVRRDLQRQIPAQIRSNMLPAYRKAATQTGQGTKQRMLDILTTHARSTADAMFQDAEQAILEGVRGLSNGLGLRFGEMASTVERHALHASENLRIGAVQLSLAEIEKEKETLRCLGAAIRELQRQNAVELAEARV